VKGMMTCEVYNYDIFLGGEKEREGTGRERSEGVTRNKERGSERLKQAAMKNKARDKHSKQETWTCRQARSICHLHIHVKMMMTTRSGSG